MKYESLVAIVSDLHHKNTVNSNLPVVSDFLWDSSLLWL